MPEALMVEPTMKHEADPVESSAEAAKKAVELQAARQAVASIPAKVRRLGGNLVQGKALQEAMRLYLVREYDYEARAKKVLAQADYPADAIDQIITGLAREFRPAA